MNVLLLFSIVIKLSVWNESQFFSIRFFFFSFYKDSRISIRGFENITERKEVGGEGKGNIYRENVVFSIFLSFTRYFLATRSRFCRSGRLIARRMRTQHDAHALFYSLSRNPCTTIFSPVKARPTFSATFSSSTFSYAEAIRYQNIFERLNNLFHREEKKMISSILSEIILPRESLFEWIIYL